MKSVIKSIIAALLLMSIMLITACLNPVSLDNYGYVISIGVDEGKEKKYYVTMALQRASLAQGNENDGGAIFLAAEGDNLFDAINTIEGHISYDLHFSRTQFFMFSRKIAESGAMEEFLSLSYNETRIRESALVLITEQTVTEYLGGLSANNSANISKFQTSLLRDQSRTGAVILTNVAAFFEACAERRFDVCAPLGVYIDEIITDMAQKTDESEGENPLAEVETGDHVGGLKSITSGVAMFDGWTMTGVLDAVETQYLHMIRGGFVAGTFTFETDDGAQIVIMLELGDTEQSMRRDTLYSDEITADIRLTLNASILQKGEMNELEAAEWLNSAGMEQIRQRLLDVVAKCKEANSDAMQIGRLASMCFTSVSEWQEYDWKSRFKNVNVVFDIKIIIDDKQSTENLR